MARSDGSGAVSLGMVDAGSGDGRVGVVRGVEVLRKWERRERVPDGCSGAGGMAERIPKKEKRGRSDGMGQRFYAEDRIWAERISYCFEAFS